MSIRSLAVLSAATPWVPSTPSGLSLYLDPNDTTTVTPNTDGSSVTAWNDKSGAGINFTNGAQAFIYKTGIVNSKNVMRASTNSQSVMTSVAMAADLSSFSFIGAIYSATNANFNRVIGSATGSQASALTLECGATNSLNCWVNAPASGAGASGGTGNNTFSAAAWHIVEVYYTSGTLTISIDNVSLGSGSNTGGLFSKNIGLGYNASFGRWNGDYGIMLLYSNVLSAGNKTSAYNFCKTWAGL